MNEGRLLNHIRIAEQILSEYDFGQPFSVYISKYFRQNRQMGSKDRKIVSRFCYHIFRLGGAFSDLKFQQRLIYAEYLCSDSSAVVELFDNDLFKSIKHPLANKILILQQKYPQFLFAIFPQDEMISKVIDRNQFLESIFVQPQLFVRVKRGKVDLFRQELQKNDIFYDCISERTFALENGTQLQHLHKLKGLYEIQDLNSQRIERFFDARDGQRWWDACAASGGKSLMLLDRNPDIDLLVSDIRMTILRNLRNRFEEAGVRTKYREKILDLSNSVSSQMSGERFDRIIVDAPCSGSGTWGRTPEMLSNPKKPTFAYYSELQRKICSNVIPFLKSGGQLIYITCSVYAMENEQIVNWLESNFALKRLEVQHLLGYDKRADSMFVACLSKN